MGTVTSNCPPLTEDQFAAEIEAEAAVANPAHERVDRAAALEADDDAFAESRLERAFHHRPAAGDVDHRHRIFGASENEDRALDQAFVTRLRSLLDDPRLCLCRHDASPMGEADRKALPNCYRRLQ